MPKPKRPAKPHARPGWGRAILFRLPDDADALLERARRQTGLDRASFCRAAVMERLSREAAA